MPKDRININNERDRKSLFKQLFKLIINNLFILKREETKEVLLTRNSLFFKPKREKKKLRKVSTSQQKIISSNQKIQRN